MENIRDLELGGSDGKESACNAGDLGLIPGLGRSPGGGHGNPIQYSCLENPCGQRNLEGYSPWGRRIRHDWTTKRTEPSRRKKSTMKALRSCDAQPEAQPCLAWMPVLQVPVLTQFCQQSWWRPENIHACHLPTCTDTCLPEHTSTRGRFPCSLEKPHATHTQSTRLEVCVVHCDSARPWKKAAWHT